MLPYVKRKKTRANLHTVHIRWKQAEKRARRIPGRGRILRDGGRAGQDDPEHITRNERSPHAWEGIAFIQDSLCGLEFSRVIEISGVLGKSLLQRARPLASARVFRPRTFLRLLTSARQRAWPAGRSLEVEYLVLLVKSGHCPMFGAVMMHGVQHACQEREARHP